MAAHISSAGYLDLGNLREECIGNPEHCPFGFTLAFWIKLSPTVPQFITEYYISSGGQTGSSYGMAVYRHTVKNHCAIAVRTRMHTWSNPRVYLHPNLWHHMIITWSEDVGLTVYLNGTESYHQGDGVIILNPIGVSSFNNLYIGRPNNVNTRYYGDFYIDELHFWSERKDADFIRVFSQEYTLSGMLMQYISLKYHYNLHKWHV